MGVSLMGLGCGKRGQRWLVFAHVELSPAAGWLLRWVETWGGSQAEGSGSASCLFHLPKWGRCAVSRPA